MPLDAGGDAYLAKNLQLLCAEHHRAKTALENRERTCPVASRAYSRSPTEPGGRSGLGYYVAGGNRRRVGEHLGKVLAYPSCGLLVGLLLVGAVLKDASGAHHAIPDIEPVVGHRMGTREPFRGAPQPAYDYRRPRRSPSLSAPLAPPGCGSRPLIAAGHVSRGSRAQSSPDGARRRGAGGSWPGTRRRRHRAGRCGRAPRRAAGSGCRPEAPGASGSRSKACFRRIAQIFFL